MTIVPEAVGPVGGKDRAAIFGRDEDGLPVGDVIPYFDNGQYHIFVLTPPPGALYFPERLRTTWRHFRSSNLRTWHRLPDALAPGAEGEPDSDGIWTGSVIKADNYYHIFYTGHSLSASVPQSVCHATSTDLIEWKKDRTNPVSVPDTDRFEARDWRDPYVFWNDGAGCYWMLLSTRSGSSPAVARGVVALQESPDLVSWGPPREMYETFLAHCPECPEVYPLEGRWVMAYSRFTDRRGTVYRFSEGPGGPWRHFVTEGPDGPHWYAAKSTEDASSRRVAFGWVPDRNPQPSTETGKWLWAGDLAIPRQISIAPGNRLVSTVPEEFLQAMVPTPAGDPNFGAGEWAVEGDGKQAYCVDARGRFGYCTLQAGSASQHFALAVKMRAVDAATVGVVVQTSKELDCGLALLWYPSEGRVRAVDLTAVRSEIANEYEKATTEYASVGEASVDDASEAGVALQVFIRGDIVEAFIAGSSSITYRLSSALGGEVALLAEDGRASFEAVQFSLFGSGVRGEQTEF